MKRFSTKSKKIISVFVLCLVSICAFSPAIKASLNNVQGTRQESNGYYRSHTYVSGFDSNGIAYNLRVTAKIGTYETVTVATGSVTANTQYISTPKDAWHSYQIGSGVVTSWQAN